MVAKQHHTPAHANTEARQQAFGRPEQHDARTIVVDECNRSLDRARGDHERARTNAEHRGGRGQPAGFAVRDAKAAGAAHHHSLEQQSHAARRESRACFGDPALRRQALDGCGFELKLAAANRLALADYDGGARLHRNPRRCEARGARADDQDITLQVFGARRRELTGARRAAESGEAPDQALVAAPRRPHERLVVKTRAPQGRTDA